jgi:hypothetical protein
VPRELSAEGGRLVTCQWLRTPLFENHRSQPRAKIYACKIWESRQSVVGAFGPLLFIRDFPTVQRDWGVTSQFPTSVSRRSNAFLRVIRLKALATQLTAFLHAGSRVTCHSVLNPCLCFRRLSRPGRSLLRSENVILLVDSLSAKAIEGVKLRVALSATSPELISILRGMNSEARQWRSASTLLAKQLRLGQHRNPLQTVLLLL